jgi:hypothetical protein
MTDTRPRWNEDRRGARIFDDPTHAPPEPTAPVTPRTEAGQRLLKEWMMLRPDHPPNTAKVRDIILAIEREAAGTEALRAALDDMVQNFNAALWSQNRSQKRAYNRAIVALASTPSTPDTGLPICGCSCGCCSIMHREATPDTGLTAERLAEALRAARIPTGPTTLLSSEEAGIHLEQARAILARLTEDSR